MSLRKPTLRRERWDRVRLGPSEQDYLAGVVRGLAHHCGGYKSFTAVQPPTRWATGGAGYTALDAIITAHLDHQPWIADAFEQKAIAKRRGPTRQNIIRRTVGSWRRLHGPSEKTLQRLANRRLSSVDLTTMYWLDGVLYMILDRAAHKAPDLVREIHSIFLKHQADRRGVAPPMLEASKKRKNSQFGPALKKNSIHASPTWNAEQLAHYHQDVVDELNLRVRRAVVVPLARVTQTGEPFRSVEASDSPQASSSETWS